MGRLGRIMFTVLINKDLSSHKDQLFIDIAVNTLDIDYRLFRNNTDPH